MKSFYTSLVAVSLVTSLGLAGSAFASGGGGGCGNGGGYIGGGYGNGGYGGSYNRNNQTCNIGAGYVTGGRAYEPFHSTYICQPGDSFYEVSLKEYGTSAAMKYIASYNRMAPNAALIPGQRLLLPSISAKGRLTASRAPAAEAIATAKFTQPTTKTVSASVVPAASVVTVSEPERTSVPSGSTLQLDGESLGSETGVVRLRISNVAIPVEVVEWSTDSTKIRLPKLDVGSSTKAELEVLRADGTVASTNAIELVAPVTGLAATN